MWTDAEHLRLLSIFQYVMAGLAAVGGCIPIIHVAVGVMIVSGKFPGPTIPATPGTPGAPGTMAAPFPNEVGWFFIMGGCAFIAMAQTIAVLAFLTGRWLAARKKATFCMVVAGIQCLFAPIGTVLGVFTILVMQRPTVRALFDANRPPRR